MDGCMFVNERPTRMCWAKNEKWKNEKIEDRIKEMEWLATSNIPLKNIVLASYMRKGNYKYQCKTMAWYLKLLASSTTVSQKSLAKEDYIPHNTYHSLNKAWWFQHPLPNFMMERGALHQPQWTNIMLSAYLPIRTGRTCRHQTRIGREMRGEMDEERRELCKERREAAALGNTHASQSA